MRLLITGYNGVIGRRFLDLYGHRFTHIYCLGRSKSSFGRAQHIFYDLARCGDIALPEIDVFLHFAGQTSARFSLQNPYVDLKINTLALVKILEILKNINNTQFITIFSGTSTQIGITDLPRPLDFEIDNPITFYDLSKFTAEKYLMQFEREFNYPTCTLRLANVYGATHALQGQGRGVIDRAIIDALKGNKLKIFGSGEQVRDYIHVDDVCSAFFTSIIKYELLRGKSFEIGTGIPTTVKDAFHQIAVLARELTGKDVTLDHDYSVALSPIDTRNFVARPYFSEKSNWQPDIDLASGIRKTIINYLQKIDI